MNKSSFKILSFLALMNLPAAGMESLREEALFVWSGEELREDGAPLPRIGPSDVGPQKDLVFSGGEFLTVSVGPQVFEELTLAFYVKPEARGKTEHFISCRTMGEDGFVFYNLHANWGFAAGDGTSYQQQHLNVRTAFLKKDEWQHIAITFERGETCFYKDGLLVARHDLSIDHIRLMAPAKLRVGSGGRASGRMAAPFTGRMAGVVILPRRLPPEEIPKLMAEMNP